MQREDESGDIQSTGGLEDRQASINNVFQSQMTKQPTNDDLGLDDYYQENSSDDAINA